MSDTKPKTDYEKPVGAVWEKETSDGRRYLSMKITGKDNKEHNFVGFLNKFKEDGDNKPTFNLFVSNKTNGTTQPVKKTVEVKKVEPTPEPEF